MKSIALTLAVLLGTLSFAAQATGGSQSDQSEQSGQTGEASNLQGVSDNSAAGDTTGTEPATETEKAE